MLNRRVKVHIGLNVKFDGTRKESFAGIVPESVIDAQTLFFGSFGREIELINEHLGEFKETIFTCRLVFKSQILPQVHWIGISI